MNRGSSFYSSSIKCKKSLEIISLKFIFIKLVHPRTFCIPCIKRVARMWHVTGQRRRAPTNLPSASTSLYFSAATNCKLQTATNCSRRVSKALPFAIHSSRDQHLSSKVKFCQCIWKRLKGYP